MKKQTWLIVGAVVLLTALPLWLVPKPASGPDGQVGEAFGGTDNQAQAAIGQIAPHYQRWFEPLLEPAIGYWLGASVTREKLRKAAKHRKNENMRAD